MTLTTVCSSLEVGYFPTFVNLSPLKKVLAALALIGFSAVVLFWGGGPHEGGNHNCISASIQNEVCPNAASPAAALFHLKALQSFSSFTVQASQLFSLLILAFAITTLFGRFRPDIVLQEIRISPQTESPPPPREYQRWLSLLEHSPSASPGRV